MRVLCKFALAIGLVPLLMGAAVYRWVDENGVVNYTQHKPEGVAAEEVSAATGSRRSTDAGTAAADTPRPDPAASRVAAEGEAELTDAQQDMLEDLKEIEAQRQAEIAKVKRANCDEARSVLANLTSRGRIRVAGEDGEYRVMPEEERQERIATAQRAVARNCADITASR